jgi:cobalt-zinc-cadmium resistance protein CzcA
LAVKIFGDDLAVMNAKADSVAQILRSVQGVKDLGILRNLGQPELGIQLSPTKMAAFGVMAEDAASVIETTSVNSRFLLPVENSFLFRK